MKSVPHYKDLMEISVQDCGELLEIVENLEPFIFCKYEKADMVPFFGNKFLLRKSVLDKLKKAAQILEEKRPGVHLRLAYGYRHPQIQKSYFEKRVSEQIKENPSFTIEKAMEQAHYLTAHPAVAGHPTGGAVDVTLEDSHGVLDMGSGIAEFSSDKINTFSDGLTEKQKSNRLLLRQVMVDCEFAPFDEEWWHFSYGDRDWAAYYKKPYAIYDQVSIHFEST